MQEYKLQEEVRIKAVAFILELRDKGFKAELFEHTFRDYCVKVSIIKGGNTCGNIVVYYKPAKDTYLLGTHELVDKSITSEVEQIWYRQFETNGPAEDQPDEYHAYVDGSFIEDAIGYGLIVVYCGEVVEERSGKISDASTNVERMRQVGGEIRAIYEALEWVQSNGMNELHIHYDYKGLECWATGAWQAKKDFTKQYQKTLQNTPIRITWHKVESHSGDRWNERADELARNGAIPVPNTTDQTDPLERLSQVALSFVEYLSKNSISADFLKIYNKMFARIVIKQDGARHLLDIYQTKKHPLEPKWHGIKDEPLKSQVETYWKQFINTNKPSSVDEANKSKIDVLDHYYLILEPYRSFAFDFAEFAKLLLDRAGQADYTQKSFDTMRFDFDLLEKMYLEMKGRNHD